MHETHVTGRSCTEYLEGFTNLQTCGRNGLHRYNNQDHSRWTAILATLNVLDGAAHDVWSVNAEADYHEEGRMIDELLLDSSPRSGRVELTPPGKQHQPTVLPEPSSAGV